MNDRKYEDLEQRLARIEAALTRLEAPQGIANSLPASIPFDQAVELRGRA